MILKVFFVSLFVAYTLGLKLLAGTDYLLGIQNLLPIFNKINLFDGPSRISAAPITTPVNVTKPTREEMMYYNYYTASVNCQYGVRTMTCGYCPKIKGDIYDFEVFDSKIHDTTGLVALSKKRKEVVAAFRATENVWNIVLDALMINTDGPDGADGIKIHTGFSIAVASIYEKVVKQIGAYLSCHPDYKLVLTGHSLGGSMSRVFEFFLLYFNEFPGITMEVYTFGELRSGNKNYVDYLNKQNVKTVRVTNQADIFPHLPPTSILGTTLLFDYYYHALGEYWINGDNEKFANQTVYEDPTCGNSLGPLYSVLDHFIYFDVNHLECLSDLPSFLALPLGLLYPVHIIPPLPKPVQNLLSTVGSLVNIPLLG